MNNLPDLAQDNDLYRFMVTVEGKRSKPYTDTKGFVSIGIGRNLEGNPLSEDEIHYLYANDVHACCAIMDQEIPWWRQLSHDSQIAMVSLCFMGWGTFSLFHRFLAAMQNLAVPPTRAPLEYLDGQLAIARRELRNSAWWNQVGQRGPLTEALLGVNVEA